MEYRGELYEPRVPFLTDNVMLYAVPTINYDYRDLTVAAGIFGDALGIAVQYNFK